MREHRKLTTEQCRAISEIVGVTMTMIIFSRCGNVGTLSYVGEEPEETRELTPFEEPVRVIIDEGAE